MIRTALLCGLLLTALNVSAQSPARAGWDDLISKSTVIVVGVVEGSFSVRRKPRTPPASERLPNGNVITDLPNIREMRVGIVTAVRVVEVIKKDGRVKPGRTVHLFIPSYPSEGMPVLASKERYLIFLDSLDPNNQAFAGAIISGANRGAGADVHFNPASYYAVVMGDNGVVPLILRNSNAVQEVKALVGKK
jgi:hypothetical protein